MQMAPQMAKKIDRGGILYDMDVIEIQAEGGIGIDNYNLPTPQNLLVAYQQAGPPIIFEDYFYHNGLCYSRVDH